MKYYKHILTFVLITLGVASLAFAQNNPLKILYVEYNNYGNTYNFDPTIYNAAGVSIDITHLTYPSPGDIHDALTTTDFDQIFFYCVSGITNPTRPAPSTQDLDALVAFYTTKPTVILDGLPLEVLTHFPGTAIPDANAKYQFIGNVINEFNRMGGGIYIGTDNPQFDQFANLIAEYLGFTKFNLNGQTNGIVQDPLPTHPLYAGITAFAGHDVNSGAEVAIGPQANGTIMQGILFQTDSIPLLSANFDPGVTPPRNNNCTNSLKLAASSIDNGQVTVTYEIDATDDIYGLQVESLADTAGLLELRSATYESYFDPANRLALTPITNLDAWIGAVSLKDPATATTGMGTFATVVYNIIAAPSLSDQIVCLDTTAIFANADGACVDSCDVEQICITIPAVDPATITGQLAKDFHESCDLDNPSVKPSDLHDSIQVYLFNDDGTAAVDGLGNPAVVTAIPDASNNFATYTFSNLLPGTYRVAAKGGFYITECSTDITVAAGDNHTGTSQDMLPGDTDSETGPVVYVINDDDFTAINDPAVFGSSNAAYDFDHNGIVNIYDMTILGFHHGTDTDCN